MDQLANKIAELDKLAFEYAKAEAERTYLENFRHSKLALLMKEAEKDGHKAINAQDREARAHPEYIELLKGLQSATEIAEYARWKLKNAHMGGSLYQTKQANMRAEMNLTKSQ